jgi:hypothetical protein
MQNWEKYLYFVFVLILVLLLVSPKSNAPGIFQTLGGAATNQIVALQGGNPQPLNGGR